MENAKTEVMNIIQKAGDASRGEVQTSQGKVDSIKAHLDEAAKVLINQTNKDELTRNHCPMKPTKMNQLEVRQKIQRMLKKLSKAVSL